MISCVPCSISLSQRRKTTNNLPPTCQALRASCTVAQYTDGGRTSLLPSRPRHSGLCFCWARLETCRNKDEFLRKCVREFLSSARGLSSIPEGRSALCHPWSRPQCSEFFTALTTCSYVIEHLLPVCLRLIKLTRIVLRKVFSKRRTTFILTGKQSTLITRLQSVKEL